MTTRPSWYFVLRNTAFRFYSSTSSLETTQLISLWSSV
jgi:hypothetical protein